MRNPIWIEEARAARVIHYSLTRACASLAAFPVPASILDPAKIAPGIEPRNRRGGSPTRPYEMPHPDRDSPLSDVIPAKWIFQKRLHAGGIDGLRIVFSRLGFSFAFLVRQVSNRQPCCLLGLLRQSSPVGAFYGLH